MGIYSDKSFKVVRTSDIAAVPRHAAALCRGIVQHGSLQILAFVQDTFSLSQITGPFQLACQGCQQDVFAC